MGSKVREVDSYSTEQAMRVLLINPEVLETFWGMRNALKFISKKSVLPPRWDY